MIDHGWLRWWWGVLTTWRSAAARVPRQGRDASNSNGNKGENVGDLHLERLFELFRSGGFVSLILL